MCSILLSQRFPTVATPDCWRFRDVRNTSWSQDPFLLLVSKVKKKSILRNQRHEELDKSWKLRKMSMEMGAESREGDGD